MSQLAENAVPRGLLGPSFLMLGIVHDAPDITSEDKLRYDAALAVQDNVQPEGEIGIQEVPASEYAVLTHIGPYTTLPDTYDRLFGDWLPSSDREPASLPAFERYWNSPYDTAPDSLRTDIYVPLIP